MDSWDHSINEDAKEVCQVLKPEEELQRFTVSCCCQVPAPSPPGVHRPDHARPHTPAALQVDEQLSDIERTNLFLTGGQLVQQRKAIEG